MIVLATGAFGAMFERGRPQTAGAIPRSKPVNLITPEGAVRATLIETTIETGRVLVGGGAAHLMAFASGKAALQVVVPGRTDLTSIPVLIQNSRDGGKGLVLDLKYMPRDAEDDSDLVRLCYGDSAVWADFQQGRQRRVPVVAGLFTLFLRGLRRSLALLGAAGRPRRAAALASDTLNQPAGR
jgi:hypothetical protein